MSKIIVASANFTRPANTTQYAAGDLIANNATAGSVTPMSFAIRGPLNSFRVLRGRLFKDSDDVANAAFRLHLFTADPTGTAPTNGDNGALQLSDVLVDWIGSLDFDLSATGIDIHTDGNGGTGVPANGAVLAAEGTTLFGLLEARGTYTPASGEVFTVKLEIEVPYAAT